ncbi:ribosome-inactivating family protein [Streptomyces sp. NPDC002817]|uniref:ribosome-inactivating family protein n=1 Tax=Streptomyces sp. NPDC088357 TaxID=3154655 RepID=UPI00341DEE5C
MESETGGSVRESRRRRWTVAVTGALVATVSLGLATTDLSPVDGSARKAAATANLPDTVVADGRATVPHGVAPLGTARRGETSVRSVIDDGNDIGWFLKDGKAGYKSMIDAVRKRVRSRSIHPSVDGTTTNANDYFTVNIRNITHGHEDAADIRVVIRARDLYVQGYYVPRGNTYLHFRPRNAQDRVLRDYRPTSQTRVLQLPFEGGYNSIEAYARGADGRAYTRRSVRLSTPDLSDAVTNLAWSEASGRSRARDLLHVIQAISEAARNDWISGRVYNNIEGAGYQPNATAVGLENNWQSLGNNFQRRLNDPRVPVHPPIGELQFSSITGMALILALTLLL